VGKQQTGVWLASGRQSKGRWRGGRGWGAESDNEDGGVERQRPGGQGARNASRGTEPGRAAAGPRWKAAGAGAEGGVAELKLTSKGEEIEKQLPGGKVKKKARPEVVLETSTRSKKKCVTTILGARPAAIVSL